VATLDMVNVTDVLSVGFTQTTAWLRKSKTSIMKLTVHGHVIEIVHILCHQPCGILILLA
jgi:hypothetical protein